MDFIKMHGAGNDYIYIDCFKENVENPKALAKKLSPYRYGVGSDGIVLIMPSKKAHCFMDIYNKDGTRGKMCGNAVRCVASYMHRYTVNSAEITVDTLSGVKNVKVFPKTQKEDFCVVNMGEPILSGHQIPTRFGDSIVKGKTLKILNREYKISCVSMGNPHCVIFLDSHRELYSLNLEKIGPHFENHEMFPEGINTEFCHIIDENHIEMRVWERGSGETYACGTGACAVCVASIINGFSKEDENIEIIAKGGTLCTNWQKNNTVTLMGNAVEVYRGKI